MHVASGEGHAEGLARLVEELVAEHEAKGTLVRRGSGVRPAARGRDRAALPEQGRAAARRHRCSSPTPPTTQSCGWRPTARPCCARYGTGVRGLVDGPAPQFAEPQGVASWPTGEVLVADTANHVVRRLDLEHRRGDHRRRDRPGLAARRARPRGPRSRSTCRRRGTSPSTTARSCSRWPARTSCGPSTASGSGCWPAPPARACATATPTRAYLAQPSGLASDGERLWFVDAETSALRWYERRAGRDRRRPAACSPSGTSTGPPRGAAPAPARAGPAARRQRRGLRHLQRRGAAVRPGRPVRSRRSRPASPSRPVRPSSTASCSSSRAPRTGWSAPSPRVRCRPAARSGAGHRRAPSPTSRPDRSSSCVVFEPPPGQHLDERDGPATRLVVRPRRPSCSLEAAAPRPG